MKHFMISVAAAAMLLGSAGLAIAQQDSGDQAREQLSRNQVESWLSAKGYTNPGAVQTGNPNGKVYVSAMKDGKPVNLEVDMQTGNIIEVKQR
jgi:hypothetical protein